MDLGAENYSNTSRWELLEPELKLNVVDGPRALYGTEGVAELKKEVKNGDTVLLPPNYANGGQGEHIYTFKGSTETFDLTKEDYSNPSRWTEKTKAEFKKDFADKEVPDTTIAVAVDETVRLSSDYAKGGVAGLLYKFIGVADPHKIDIAAEDYSKTSRWELAGPDITGDGLPDGDAAKTVTADHVIPEKVSVATDDTVFLPAGYSRGGIGEEVYKFLAADENIDLSQENYATSSRWELLGDNVVDHRFLLAEARLEVGDTVLLDPNYTNGGTPNEIYRFKGPQQLDPNGDVVETDLSREDYSIASRWELVPREKSVWQLVDGGGDTYTLELVDGTKLKVAKANITAVAVAAAVSVGIGTGTGFSAAGGGAVSKNTITTKTNAHVDSSKLTSADDVLITSANKAHITAVVVGAALSVGIGDKAGFGVSIGVAIAKNFIGYDSGGTKAFDEVRAYVTGTSIQATGDLLQSASSERSIKAFVLAASVAIAGSGEGFGLAAAGSGVRSENKIAADIKATADGDGATGINAGTASLTATDDSTISSFAGSASISAAVSAGFSGSAAIAATIARNSIDNTIEASIKDADSAFTTTSGDVTVKAEDKAQIKVIAFAASLAVAFGGGGVSLSGAGADARNSILTETSSLIDSSKVTSAGNVDMDAVSNSNIKAWIGAFALSLNIAPGAGAAIGVVIARNTIGWASDSSTTSTFTTDDDDPASIQKGNRVKVAQGIREGDVFEYLDDTAISDPNPSADDNYLLNQNYGDEDLWKRVDLVQQQAPVKAIIKDSTVTASAGNVTLDATSTQTIDAFIFAAAGAVSGPGYGISGAGTGAVNRIAVLVDAHVENSTVTSKSVSLKAEDSSTVKAVVGSVSLAIGLGGALTASVGIAKGKNEISNEVKAAILDNSTVTASSGSLTLQSTESASIKVVTVSVSASAALGATGIAFSGAGAISKNVINTKTNAYVDGSTVKASANNANIDVLASNTATINSKIVGVSVGIGGGAGNGLAVAIGASKAENLFGFNSGGSPLAEVQAYINGSSADTGGNLDIKATNTATIEADIDVDSVAVGFGGLAAGAGAAVGVDVVNQMAVTIKAYLSSSTGSHIDVTGNTTIEAKDTATIDSDVLGVSIAAAYGPISGAVSIAISLAKNEVANTVEAFVHTAKVDSSSGSMTITANETVTFNSVARAVAAAASIGAGFSGGGAVSKNILKTATRGYVDNSTVNLGGTLTINSTDLSSSDSQVKAVAASLGFIAAAGSGADATTEITSTTEAYVNRSDVDAGGDILVTAAERPDAFGKADGVAIAVGFGGGVGSTDVNTTLNPTVNAWLGTKLTEIKAGGSIKLRALYNVDDDELPMARGARSQSSATGGSLVGVVGADAQATQKPVINVNVVTNSRVQASGNIEIKALSNLELDMDVDGDSGGLVGVGATDATYTIDVTNAITFEEDSSVQSLTGAVTTKAETTADGIKARTDGGTGGLIGVAEANTNGTVTIKTTIDLAERAEVIAATDLSLETHLKPGIRSEAEVDVGGGFADAATNAPLNATLTSSVTAAAKSRLTGTETATMKAHVTFVEMVAKTESDAYGLFVDADADSNVTVVSNATILFKTGAAILGKNSLVLETLQIGPDDGILSHASAGAHGIGGSDSDGNNTTTLTTAVTFEGADLTSDDLKITATKPSDAIYEKLANDDKNGTLTNTSEVTSTGATLDANNGKLTINADKATTDNSSLLKANELAVTAVNDVVLRMNSGSVTVKIAGTGDLTINARDNINLTEIDVDDGKADITSRGTIEVTDVDVSKDVNLTSAEALIVYSVKAGDDLTLSAIGAIREPASFDADIDAAGDNVKVTSGQVKPTDGTAIETQGALTESYAVVNPALDLSNVNTTGNLFINAAGYTGPVNIQTTGSVILFGLDPQPGQAITIDADGDIITDGIDTGTTGSLTLTADGSFISTGELKGSPVNITAGGITVYEIDTDPTVVNLDAGTGPVELLGPVIADELNVTAGRLTVDVGAVGTFPATFNYTGQTSNDSLNLINGTPGDVSYSFTGSSTGTLSSDGNTINHTSVEVITDSQVSTNRTFSFTSSNADTITLGDDGVTDGVTKLSSASSGATVFFTNSVETFTLNTGDGGDHVTIHNFDAQDGQGNTYGGTVTVNGEDGNDTLDGVSSTYPLNLGGGIGDDAIAGGSDIDNIAGGEGEDNILGRDGNDRVVGDKARFNNGIDFTAVNSLTITSFEAFGNSDDDIINGGVGDDILVGGVGQDTITGEDGNDILIGDNAIVLLTPVFIITTNDVDSVTFVVLGGADTLSGGSGRDVLIGGAGGDTLTGGADADVLIGDQGIYTVEKYETQSFVDGGGNSIGGGQDTLTGEDGNDVVLGGDDQDTINGNDGDDILLGDNGQITRDATGASDLTADSNQVTKGDNDTINGGAGDDVIFGGTLVDTISGGEGDDVVYGDHAFADFNDPANPIFASTDTGPDDNTGGDTINGEAGDDILHGQRGDDTINGGDGEDEIYGGLNDDLINGGAGHDTILGDRGVIVRAVDNTGSPVFDANGKWHRDVVTFSGSFEISDLIDIDTTPLFSTAGTEARELFLADLLLAVGNLDGAGTRQMLSNGAWNTDLLVLQALDGGAGHGGDDTLNGDDGDDAIFGQYGDDTLSGNDGDDYLAGGTGQDNLDGGAGTNSLIADTASGVTPFHSQQPANLQGIFVSEAAAGVDVTVGTETFAGQMLLGALVFPEVDLMPIIANDAPIMSSFIPESLSVAFDLAKNDSMTGTSDGRLIKGYISAIPDALHHLDQLQASDTINTGSGNDFIVGDSVSTVADFKTNNSTIDNLFRVKVLPALTRLVNHLHETEPLFQTFRKANGLATEPHDIELGNDTINGADGNDFIVGDNVTIVTPVLLGVLGESAETAVQDGLDLVQTLHDVLYVANDLNQVVLDLQNTLFDIIDSTNGRNSIMKLQGDEDLHDIIAGRDTLTSGEGEDIVVGDNANFIMPVMTGLNSTVRRLDPLNGNVQLVNLDLQLARDYGNHEAAHYDPFNFVRVGQNIRIEFFDEFFGNDTITGNEGNDILVGDYATIGVPILVDTNDLNNLEDEFRAFDKALGDFEQNIVNRRPERRLDHTLESGLDAISGGDGNDSVFGDYVRIIRPITTTGTVYRDFTFSVSETGYLPFMRSRGRKVVLADDVILGGDGSDTMLGQRGTNFINSIENDFFGDTRDLVITGRLQDRVENSINTTVDNLISKLIATGSTLNLEGELNLKF